MISPESNDKQNSEGFYKNIYKETRECYERLHLRPGGKDCGFKILNGPPHPYPPVLFIGYQPGGSTEDCQKYKMRGAHKTWPLRIEYQTECWPLATEIRSIFAPLPNGNKVLDRCVALNAIFFRAPDIQTWNALPSYLRKKVVEFCLPHVKSIVNAVKPRLIIVNGFATAKLFGEGVPDVRSLSPKERILTKTCTIENYPALATLHLSGAHISALDRELLYDRVRIKIKSKNPEIS